MRRSQSSKLSQSQVVLVVGHEVPEREEVAYPSELRWSIQQANILCFIALSDVKRSMYVERVSC